MISQQNPTDNTCCVGYNENLEPYNRYSSQCRNGKVSPLNVNLCGEDEYDESKDLCCNGVEIYRGKKKAGYKCCRQSLYAYGPGQICCRGVVYNITKQKKRFVLPEL